MEASGSSTSTALARSIAEIREGIERESVCVTKSHMFTWVLTDSQGTPKRGGDPMEISTGPLEWLWKWTWVSSNVHDLNTDLVLKAGARRTIVWSRAVIYSRQGSNSVEKFASKESVAVVKLRKALSLSLTNVVVPTDKRKNLVLSIFMEIYKIFPIIDTPECSLANDIESTIENNENFQDITLLVGPERSREVIKANKFMLVARSPVFARMFQSDMIEASTNSVEITDINPNVFKKVLSFIYSGIIVGLSSLTVIQEIIIAADNTKSFVLKLCVKICS